MELLKKLAQLELEKAFIMSSEIIPFADVIKLRIINGEIADLRAELDGPPPWTNLKEMTPYLK